MKYLIIVLSLIFAGVQPVSGIDPDPLGYERILVPIAAQSRPGAFGSTWRTDVTIRNASADPAHIFQQQCAFFCTCPLIISCSAGEIPPHTTFRTGFVPAGNPANVGVFIYVNARLANDLAVQIRVRDTSHSTDSWGTEVPAVRDHEMRTRTTHLLDIPIRDGFRQHLRLYAASSPSGSGDLLVRIFRQVNDELLDEIEVRLEPGSTSLGHVPARLPADHELPDVPGYAEIPSLRTVAGDEETIVRLEVIPITPGIKFWAMVSVTNNTTQQVTLITPQ